MSLFASEGKGRDVATSNLIIWLSEADSASKGVIGNKASHLARLLCAGFHVPAGFCITERACWEHILSADRGDLAELVSAGRWEQLRQSLLQVSLNQDFVAEVSASYDRLMARHSGLVVVRSSATAEDLPGHSFAGIYESVLSVDSQRALLDAIRRCWASYWSVEAVEYRDKLGIGHLQHGMGVLVQTMVRSKFAGVLFTRSPLHKGQDVMAAELVPGNAATLLDGTLRGDGFLIDRATRHVRSLAATNQGVAPPFLNELASLGLAVEEYQRTPQDIEWCLDEEDQIWIVQARPATGTGEVQNSATLDRKDGWERVEYEPFSPLGCDLAVRRYRYWVEALNDYYKSSFTPYIETARNFLYYKPTWRSPSRLRRIWIVAWKLLRWLRTGQVYKQYVDEILPAHVQRLSELDKKELSNLSDRDLLADFNATIESYLELQYSSIPVIETTKTATRLFDLACRLMFKDQDLRAADFLNGLDNHTVSRDLALQRLGQSIGELFSPEELMELDYLALMSLEEQHGAGRELIGKLRAFLDEYGYVWADRYPRDPAWEINWDLLFNALAQAAQTSPDDSLKQQHTLRKEMRDRAVQRAAQHLSSPRWLSLRWRVFRWLRTWASRLYPHKENRNHHVYRNVMVIRKYAREIGRRLARRKLLQTLDDVCFLTWKEIQEVMLGETEGGELIRLVVRRKGIYEHSKRQAQGGSNGGEQRGSDENSQIGTTEVVLKGEPSSPGIAVGPSCLVGHFGELHRVKSGDVLVCRELRPAWSPAFAIAAAVVVETGSLLSHGATLAREYGIPAVMNIPKLFERICDGDTVAVDGNRGVVTVERNKSSEGVFGVDRNDG